MEQIAAAIIGFVATVIVAIIGAVTALRFKIGPNSDKLVSILQGIVDAQDIQIRELEERIKSNQVRIQELEKSVRDMTAVIVEQELEIARLTKIAKESLNKG